ncbi:MAG: 50S ribosomal protein L18 [Alphaproteobacteria bacterium]|jgi:large subunit ribosomal protein L18
MPATNTNFARRKVRVRKVVRRASNGRARLSVFRSSKQIYAQVIDDAKGHTVASASTLDKELAGKLKTGADTAAAAEVGKLVAARAVAAGVTTVVFDRGGYMFHGRVKALADAAREGGLSF